MMTDEKLKNIYQAASKDEPSSAIDQLILAEAAAELDSEQEDSEKKLPWRGWRPLVATAASITLVATLAFQLIPLHEQQWQDATTTAPVKFEVAKEKLQPAEAKEANKPGADIVQEALPEPQKYQASPATLRSSKQAEVSAMKKAHAKSDSMRERRLAERKLRRQEVATEIDQASDTSMSEQFADQAVEAETITVLSAPIVALTQQDITNRITRINELREQGLTKEARQMWLALLDEVKDPPTEEPLKSMWQEVATAFK